MEKARDCLIKSGHDSWPKVTGGKGIHIMVPIEPKMTHDAAHRYARGLAQRLAATAPSRYTLSATMSQTIKQADGHGAEHIRAPDWTRNHSLSVGVG